MAEILHQLILHQLIGSLSHYSQGFVHPRWFSRRISEPSTVCPYRPYPIKTTQQASLPKKPPTLSDLALLDPGGLGCAQRSKRWALEPVGLGVPMVGMVISLRGLLAIYTPRKFNSSPLKNMVGKEDDPASYWVKR